MTNGPTWDPGPRSCRSHHALGPCALPSCSPIVLKSLQNGAHSTFGTQIKVTNPAAPVERRVSSLARRQSWMGSAHGWTQRRLALRRACRVPLQRASSCYARPLGRRTPGTSRCGGCQMAKQPLRQRGAYQKRTALPCARRLLSMCRRL